MMSPNFQLSQERNGKRLAEYHLTHSASPAVRIYTAKGVKEELLEAQREFIQASLWLRLHCYAKSLVEDSNLAVWISKYLPPHQAGFVEQCISQRRQSLLASRNSGILPFDTRFRYLLLPDNNSFE